MGPGADGKRERVEALLVEQWGRMATLWGITPSAGRVAGLLFASPGGLTQEAIADRLGISQGNVSMALRDLAAWGLVRQGRKTGSRSDHYEVEADVWKLFLAVLRERRRREFETMLSTLNECLHELPKTRTLEDKALGERLEKAKTFYGVMDRLADRILSGGEKLLRVMAAWSGR